MSTPPFAPIFAPVTRVFAAFAAGLAAVVLAGPAVSAGNPEIAALQVALSSRGLYNGTVDGVLGAGTSDAVRRFQRQAGLPANGVPGPSTRAALGQYGRPAPLGRRTLLLGMRGWDVAALQFALAWHGFPSGTLDGHLGLRTETALRRFQAWAGLKADGRAEASTFAALRAPVPRSPLALSVPVEAPTGDVFGPRGKRFHSGLDFTASSGTAVSAAGSGRVVFAGRHTGGWGNLVVVQHGLGVRTLYAHLSRIDVKVGQLVSSGEGVGLVGATGQATGPHLHFEVLVRGAAVDPQTALRRPGRRAATPGLRVRP
jgi:peptidoglycan hydrolase-like protein with peptidoglycan-binding domain